MLLLLLDDIFVDFSNTIYVQNLMIKKRKKNEVNNVTKSQTDTHAKIFLMIIEKQKSSSSRMNENKLINKK